MYNLFLEGKKYAGLADGYQKRSRFKAEGDCGTGGDLPALLLQHRAGEDPAQRGHGKKDRWDHGVPMDQIF